MKKRTLAAAVTAATIAVSGTAAFAAPGANVGPSSSDAPYLVRSRPGIVTTSVLTTGDAVGGYRMAGTPDGLGAYDNGDGTFTVLMNHELGNDKGVTRAHGGRGSFVSKWTVDSETLQVLAGQDLITEVWRWDAGAGQWVAESGTGLDFSRFCSADLADPSAFLDAASGTGTTERIYLTGEESGATGRAVATVATGPDAGNAYELPWLGRMSFENVVAKPGYGEKTAVATLDDSGGGQVYFYVGEKRDAGNEVEKAGLTGGHVWGLKIADVPTEGDATGGAGSTFSFTLVDLGDASTMTGAELEAASRAAGVSALNRPEDGSWDRSDPANFYFNTTASFTGISRLWKLDFADPTDLTKGGTASVAIASPPHDPTKSDAAQAGPRMLDNLTVNERGQVVASEDVGNNAYLGGVWQYDPSTGVSTRIATADPARFTPGAAAFLTKDEEASGVIPVPFLGAGKYLIDLQNHAASTDPALVEGGQLMLLQVPPGKPLR